MIGMGNLSLMVSLLRARKSGHICQEPSFFRNHDHRRRVGARTRVDSAYIKEFLDHFLNFNFFGKRGDDTDGYWEEGFLVQGEWNDHEHHWNEGDLGEWKILVNV